MRSTRWQKDASSLYDLDCSINSKLLECPLSCGYFSHLAYVRAANYGAVSGRDIDRLVTAVVFSEFPDILIVILLPLSGTHTHSQHCYCTTICLQSDKRSSYSGKDLGDHGHAPSSLPIDILPSLAMFRHFCIRSGRPKVIPSA